MQRVPGLILLLLAPSGAALADHTTAHEIQQDIAAIEQDISAIRSDVDSIDGETGGLMQRTQDIFTDTGLIRGDTGSLLLDTSELRMGMDETLDTLSVAREEFLRVTPEIRDKITEAVEAIQASLEEDLEGLDEFAPGGDCDAGPECVAFRDGLIDFTGSLGMLAEGLINFDFGIDPQATFEIDPQRFQNGIARAPGSVLYVFFKVLNLAISESDPGGEGVPMGPLDYIAEQIVIFLQDVSILENAFYNPCAFSVDRRDDILLQARVAFSLGASIRATGEIVKLLGTTLNPVGQVHGYTGFFLEDDKIKKLGTFLSEFSRPIVAIGSLAYAKVRRCQVVGLLCDAAKRDSFGICADEGFPSPTFSDWGQPLPNP